MAATRSRPLLRLARFCLSSTKPTHRSKKKAPGSKTVRGFSLNAPVGGERSICEETCVSLADMWRPSREANLDAARHGHVERAFGARRLIDRIEARAGQLEGFEGCRNRIKAGLG